MKRKTPAMRGLHDTLISTRHDRQPAVLAGPRMTLMIHLKAGFPQTGHVTFHNGGSPSRRSPRALGRQGRILFGGGVPAGRLPGDCTARSAVLFSRPAAPVRRTSPRSVDRIDMTQLQLGLLVGAGLPLLVAIVLVADRRGFFRLDGFPTPLRRRTALGL